MTLATDGTQGCEAGGSTTEAALADIWRELLAVGEIRSGDDFVTLGGDSVSAKRMLVLIEERFRVSVSFETLFDALALSELAAHIDTLRRQPNSAAAAAQA